MRWAKKILGGLAYVVGGIIGGAIFLVGALFGKGPLAHAIWGRKEEAPSESENNDHSGRVGPLGNILRVGVIIENDLMAEADASEITLPKSLMPAADNAMSGAGFIATEELLAFLASNQPELIATHRMENAEADEFFGNYAQGSRWQNYRAETDFARYNVVVVLNDT